SNVLSNGWSLRRPVPPFRWRTEIRFVDRVQDVFLTAWHVFPVFANRPRWELAGDDFTESRDGLPSPVHPTAEALGGAARRGRATARERHARRMHLMVIRRRLSSSTSARRIAIRLEKG